MQQWDRKEAERQAAERIERQDQAVNHPAQRSAMDQLKALANVPGALKVITINPDPKAPPVGPQHPHFFVAHDVVKIEGPDHNGNLWAHTKEGDFCKGNALALIERLTQHGRAEPFTEPREVRSTRSGPGRTQMRVDQPLKAE